MLGERFEWPQQVEVVLVGSAAAILTGVLTGPDAVTTDCDPISYDPDVWDKIEPVASDLGDEIGLGSNWFNSDVRTRLSIEMLPEGWRSRSIIVGTYGCLKVVAVSRPDLIAMKFLARRAQDLKHLEVMRVTSEEIDFTRRWFEQLPAKGERPENLDEAMEVLESWEATDG